MTDFETFAPVVRSAPEDHSSRVLVESAYAAMTAESTADAVRAHRTARKLEDRWSSQAWSQVLQVKLSPWRRFWLSLGT